MTDAPERYRIDWISRERHESPFISDCEGSIEYVRSDLAPREAVEGELTFAALRKANESRCAQWHGLSDWSVMEWACAMAGEAGEACNVAKKIKRIETGIAKNPKEIGADLTPDLAEECADVMIYLDLLCASRGIDLAAAVVAKFNAVSKRYDFPQRISRAAAPIRAESEGVVERGAKALYDQCPHLTWIFTGSGSSGHSGPPIPWESLGERDQENYRDKARIVLAARAQEPDARIAELEKVIRIAIGALPTDGNCAEMLRKVLEGK